MFDIPLAYFITFSCYGSRLHGDARGTVDRRHNRYGSQFLPFSQRWAKDSQTRMKQPSYKLDATRRELVSRAIMEVCNKRGWRLLAAHVRTRHVHSVIASDTPPELVMIAMKASASKLLNETGLDPPDSKRWSRHGSTAYLWKQAQLFQTIDYVVKQQGQPMSLFVEGEPADSVGTTRTEHGGTEHGASEFVGEAD
ncbi:MAG: transposase [Acidobacteriota bacterium]